MTDSSSIPADTRPQTRDLRTPVSILLFLLALCSPLFLGTYAVHALVIAMIFLLPAHGLNLLVGYTGMLSLAQAAFFGIGAYCAALMATHFDTSFPVNLLAAVVLAMAVAVPLGIPALQLRATSFVMCTLGFVIITQAIAKNWISVTRGDMGLSGLPKPTFSLGGLSWTASTAQQSYYVALGLAALATFVFWLIVRSPAGRNLIAIRENETLAESLGVPTWRYRLAAFVLAAGFAGAGGALYAHYISVASPLMFQTLYTTTMLIIVLGGGSGSISGVVIGSILFVALSEGLRIAPELRMIAYGACLLLLVFRFPQGFAPYLSKLWDRIGGQTRKEGSA
ncbi:branched-chain amino acid ABC transporter permease [Alloyangia pacifica]|uniref:branched-chain amino acid ABC transporter permease n=1 Tax=Alloyangia pacifica TaxID=311180 RepID=UPI001CFCAAC6|nr:branched-chain amino acid ABC transporter permease [Alloyangia pacifica]